MTEGVETGLAIGHCSFKIISCQIKIPNPLISVSPLSYPSPPSCPPLALRRGPPCPSRPVVGGRTDGVFGLGPGNNTAPACVRDRANFMMARRGVWDEDTPCWPQELGDLPRGLLACLKTGGTAELGRVASVN